MTTIRVKMKRGGFINLEAEGRVYKDSYGSGEKFMAVDDFAVYWPGGGVVNEKNYDVDQALEAFVDIVTHD